MHNTHATCAILHTTAKKRVHCTGNACKLTTRPATASIYDRQIPAALILDARRQTAAIDRGTPTARHAACRPNDVAVDRKQLATSTDNSTALDSSSIQLLDCATDGTDGPLHRRSLGC